MLCPSLHSNCSWTCHGIQSSKFMLNQVWGFRKLIRQPDMTPAVRRNLYSGNLLCIERSLVGLIMSTWIQVPTFISISWNTVYETYLKTIWVIYISTICLIVCMNYTFQLPDILTPQKTCMLSLTHYVIIYLWFVARPTFSEPLGNLTLVLTV